MKSIFYLKTCDTCRRIIKSLPNIEGFELREIKQQPITVAELEEMHRLAGSYEALFSRKATLYKERGMKDMTVTEADYKNYILEHPGALYLFKPPGYCRRRYHICRQQP